MAHVQLQGIGAYPTDPYYDPDRPSWLPYWLDTPTESIRKWTGYHPTVTELETRQIEEIAKTDPAAAAEILRQLAARKAEEGKKPGFVEEYGTYLLLGVAGVVLFMALKR